MGLIRGHRLLVFFTVALLVGTIGVCQNIRKKMNAKLWWDIPVVAHAGGGINGRTSTNSLEAMNLSADSGYRIIEVDLSLTSDEELILLHWDADTGETLEIEPICENSGGDALSLNVFQNMKICRKYTPMTGKDLVQWMKKHPSIYIMLDSKYSRIEELKLQYQRLTEICNFDSKLLNRFIVQIYDTESFECIMDTYSFPNIIYAAYRHAEKKEEYWEQVASECSEKGIKVVLMGREYVATRKHAFRPYIGILKENGLLVCVYTVNTITELERMVNAGADIIISDYLTENDLQYLEQH